jgi:hypothetical protein
LTTLNQSCPCVECKRKNQWLVYPLNLSGYLCIECFQKQQGSKSSAVNAMKPKQEEKQNLEQKSEEQQKPDVIASPIHYTRGIECWDYITSHKLGYLEGNIIKYVTRYKLKNGKEDLLKAKAYLERLIREVE